MKLKSLLLGGAILLSVCAGAQTTPANTISGSGPRTTTFKARADNLFWVSDAPGANFDEKLQACYEASDAATPDLIRIKINWTGKSWVMKKPVDWRPRHGDQLRVWMPCDEMWCLINWQGEGGTASNRLLIWRFTGLKESNISNLKGVGNSNYVVWMTEATTLKINSSGNNVWSHCRWQPRDGTVGNVGFWVGYSDDRTGHNDHAAVTLDKCSMDFYPAGSSNNNGAWGVMETAVRAGHRAFIWSGYNTTANVMRDCAAVNCWGITTTGFQGQDPGGSSLVVSNFGTSGSPLVFNTFIGSTIYITGGRHELGGQAFLQGSPTDGNGNAGLITLTDTQFEDFSPGIVAPYLKTSPHAMVSVHDASNLVMSNVRFAGDGTADRLMYPDWLELWCNKADERPVVSLTGIAVSNGFGTNKVVVKTAVKIREGTWKTVIDGVVSTTTVVRAN